MATAVALKLFTGADTPQTPREHRRHWTLREACEEITEPLLRRRGRAAGSVAKYWKAIWYWEAFHRVLAGQAADGTDRCDPGIGEISAEQLDSFAEALVAKPFGLRTNTAANQQLMYVESVLRSCGPRVGRKGGAGIIEEVPFGERLPAQAPSRQRRRITDELLADIYDACRFAQFPQHPRLPAPAVWRALFVTGVVQGPRRCELAELATSADVRTPECPDESIDVTSPHGWLQFHTPKTRRVKGGKPLCLPVAPCVRVHLDALRELDPRRSRLFPIGDTPSTWRKWFRRIQERAGIREPYTFQELRKTCSIRYRRHAGREVAKFMLGQQPRGVNERWYDDLTEDAIKAVLTLPQPEPFLISR